MSDPTPTSLNFVYDGKLDCEVARVSPTLRVRAERENHPSNPFVEFDGNWPLCVRSPDGYGSRCGFKQYSKVGESGDLLQPLDFANDAEIVHLQHNLARDLGFGSVGLLLAILDLDDLPVKRCHDAGLLRDAIGQTLGDVSDSDKLEVCAKLYATLGIPALCAQSRGYSQGDWAEVLVVATPQARKTFGFTGEGEPDTANLQGAVDLYGAWAWGDVYGYVVEKLVDVPCPDDGNLLADDGVCGFCGNQPDDHEPEWEEVPDGSCWGYYGSDHHETGLAEAALEVVRAHTRELEAA